MDPVRQVSQHDIDRCRVADVHPVGGGHRASDVDDVHSVDVGAQGVQQGHRLGAHTGGGAGDHHGPAVVVERMGHGRFFHLRWVGC